MRASPAPHVEIVVPVCNADRRVLLIVDHYAALGLRPLFIVDDRSSDASLALLQSHGARVLLSRSAYARAESLLCRAVPEVEADWILRFDDDEAPSRPLLAWIAQNIASLAEPAVGFSRRWVRFDSNAGIVGSSCVRVDGRAVPDWQFRLFRPADVHLIQDIHTPGFTLESHALAPEEANFHHLSWIVRSYAERRARIEQYERQSPGAGRNFTVFYLPEDHDPSFYDFAPVHDPDLRGLATRLTYGLEQGAATA